MDFTVRLNGVKIGYPSVLRTEEKIKKWGELFHNGKIEIIPLTETKMLESNKMQSHSLIDNLGAYKVNPYTCLA